MDTTTPTTSLQQQQTTSQQSNDPLLNNDDDEDGDESVSTGPDGRVYFVAEQVSHHPPSMSGELFLICLSNDNSQKIILTSPSEVL